MVKDSDIKEMIKEITVALRRDKRATRGKCTLEIKGFASEVSKLSLSVYSMPPLPDPSCPQPYPPPTFPAQLWTLHSIVSMCHIGSTRWYNSA